MALPARHIVHQGRVLSAIGGTVLDAARRRVGWAGTSPTTLDRARTAEVPALDARLVRDYIRHVGGDPAAYRGILPPHLFPQWSFPLAAATLRGLDYPLLKVVNGGCRLEMHAPLPAGQPLRVSARLVSVEDDGRRAVLRQQVVTSTATQLAALVAEIFAIVPSGGKHEQGGRSSTSSKSEKSERSDRVKEAARVPSSARELAFWRLRADAGLGFALLTGDFNPVHWLRPYARASGFRSPILHGFATLARAMEGLNRALFSGAVDRLATVDVRFTRPLLLPARVGLYVDGTRFFVGDAAGGPAYLTGSFSERTT